MNKLSLILLILTFSPAFAMEADQPNQQILDDKLYNELMYTIIYRPNAQQLIDDGADVNRRMGRSNQYKTLLHCCICRSFEQSCQLLLENGANPNLNRMDYVLNENAWEPIIAETPLVAAIKYCSPATVQLLISAGADVNTPEMDGTTPLVAACRHQTAEICELLIDKKAIIQGLPETAAILCRVSEWTTAVEICTLFLKSGLDPLLKLNSDCETFLIKAAQKIGWPSHDIPMRASMCQAIIKSFINSRRQAKTLMLCLTRLGNTDYRLKEFVRQSERLLKPHVLRASLLTLLEQQDLKNQSAFDFLAIDDLNPKCADATIAKFEHNKENK